MRPGPSKLAQHPLPGPMPGWEVLPASSGMLYGAGSRSLGDSCFAGLLLRCNVLRRRVSGIEDAFLNFLFLFSVFRNFEMAMIVSNTGSI